MKILGILLCYIIGSLSNAYLVVKHFKGIDIRTVGSGNPGATNVQRVAGNKLAFLVFLLDVLKGVVAVLIGRVIGGEFFSLWCGVSVIVGHNWPLFFGLKGGKGTATSLGVIWLTVPKIALIITVVGITSIIVTRYVSLASILAAPLFPTLIFISRRPFQYFIFGLILMSMTLYRHRSNIDRLMKGQESRLGDKVKIK